MGKGLNASAYRDMDEEYFTSLEDADYKSYESPTKSTSLSESTILQRHWSQRRALRSKIVVGVSCLVLVAVGATALYSTTNATIDALTMSGPSAMLRGRSHTSFSGPAKPSKVFGGDAFPDLDAVSGDVKHKAKETDIAPDDLLLDEEDAYDYRKIDEEKAHV